MRWSDHIIYVEVALWAGKEEQWIGGTSQTHGMTETGPNMACRLRQSESGDFKGQVGRDTGWGREVRTEDLGHGTTCLYHWSIRQ